MKAILLSILIFSGSAQAYQELKTYKDLKITNPTQKTWVIFDIDNTLTHPYTTIGSVEWVEYMKTRYVQAGFTPEAAAEKQHELFGLTQMPFNAQLVDNSVFDFIQGLPKDFNVFALTARNKNLVQVTTDQLAFTRLMGVLEARPPKFKQKPAELFWERGILFATGQDKGKLLELMVANVDAEPDRIIFIDDKTYNVEAFDQAMERINQPREHKIEFQSYHFTAANKWIVSMDTKKADRDWYQFRYLNHSFGYINLASPVDLASELLNQQAMGLTSNLAEKTCAVQSQTGDQVLVDCAYKDCTDWDYTQDGDALCEALSSETKHVSYELQYLKDLEIYIRPGWEFLR